ncbi:hypothetical protein ACFLTS_07525 [Chloroflexota bacterium]
MGTDDLIFRVRRIYSAVGAVEEADISKFVAQEINDGRKRGFYQDWSGGKSKEELTNTAWSLISNIANLEAHLKKWTDDNGLDKTKVDAALNNSQALKIIKDLHNKEKHPYPPRKGGYSGLSPRVGEINSTLQLTVGGSGKPSAVSVIISPQGIPKKSESGSGTAKVVISGDIFDGDGNKTGDLYKVALEAIEVWETVLGDFGVTF